MFTNELVHVQGSSSRDVRTIGHEIRDGHRERGLLRNAHHQGATAEVLHRGPVRAVWGGARPRDETHGPRAGRSVSWWVPK
jgi:hypothetical protein